jgi:hypothetical protein
MNDIVRPGIDKKWSMGAKAHLRNQRAWVDDNLPAVVRALEHYVATGTRLVKQPSYGFTFKEWETYLAYDLRMYADLLIAEAEIAAIAGKPFDTTAAVHAFAAGYTASMIETSLYQLSLARTDHQRRGRNPGEIMIAGLGMVIGCRAEATRMTRLLAHSYRSQWFDTSFDWPAHAFVLRLMADFVGDPPIALHEEIAHEPIFTTLFSLWRTPDPAQLQAVCLAACDLHTKASKFNDMTDFSHGPFTRTPIEMLVLFKLRGWLGLENPELDHPLMQWSLGRLPQEVLFEPDDLTRRLRARIAADGYDEEVIFNRMRSPGA